MHSSTRKLSPRPFRDDGGINTAPSTAPYMGLRAHAHHQDSQVHLILLHHLRSVYMMW
jgi:hypothetical protein